VSSTGARPRRGWTRQGWTRQGWTLSDDEAQTLLANARRAFFVMVGILAVLWIIQIINEALGTDPQGILRLTADYGIRPRDVAALPYILTAPFLHFSWTHIEGNSGPLFIFGFLAAYRGLGKFAAVSVIVILTSGLAAWFFESSGSVGAGASGVVFGYFGYIMVRGLFDRRAIDVLIGAVMALCFAYQFSVLLPHQGIGWQAHVGGVVGGILCGWLLRDRRAARTAQAAAPRTARKAATSPASASQGTVAVPKTQAGQLPATQPGQPSPPAQAGKKGFQVDPANPRADLYKQLDDLGL
jgi:membrane associated rhomboid family serine protease